MATEEEKIFCIYEDRNETMVSPEGGKPTARLARFLKPSAKNITQAPKFPIHSQTLSHKRGQHSHPKPKVHFKGWKNPQKKWGEWVDYLAGKHAFTWNQTGICDAVLSSLYEIRCDPHLILGLVEYWCPETNTFVFPWGEAAITLEDVVILGGFSVLGEPVTLPLTNDLLSMEAELKELKRQMCKSKSKKADHGSWIKFFMEEEVSHGLEHVGFLSLWLSRFVFPSLPESTILRHIFPIAIHLSQGTRMALAPAVLASIYENLRLLKEQLVSSMDGFITVMGPFQIVQQWAFERFPILGPKYPIELKQGEPRAARWHKLKSNASVSLIASALKSAKNFQWLPFAADLKNWCFVSHYKDNEQLVVDSLNLAEELRSFGRCLCANELVGIHCTEKYMPYRVAMQLGMDQHLHGEFSVMPPNCSENFSFYVPASCYIPSVSLEYLNWWQESKLVQEKGILNPERKQIYEEESHTSTASGETGSKRKLSTKEESNLMENKSHIVGKDMAAQEGVAKGNTMKSSSSYLSGLNSEIEHHKRLLGEEGREQHAAGTSNNPLNVDDYACTTYVGTSAHPINIENYI